MQGFSSFGHWEQGLSHTLRRSGKFELSQAYSHGPGNVSPFEPQTGAGILAHLQNTLRLQSLHFLGQKISRPGIFFAARLNTHLLE